MKSEVKKKMMFNEHATHTPKSLQRSSSRNFFAGNRSDCSYQLTVVAKA